MTGLEFYEALHVMAVVIWLGGAFVLQLFALLAARATEESRVFVFKSAEWIGQRFFLGSSIVVLVSGFLMLGELPYGLGDGWVLFGFIVILLSAATGAGFLGPESGRIAKLMETETFGSAPVQARYQRLLTLARIELLLLFLVVADMVARPGA
jgi:uncharacterized membrane protein